MSLLGIDVGTTGCKAAAFSEAGHCISHAYREYPMLQPRPNWAELDSRRVWELTKEAIAEVAGETKADPITALSVSSLGEAMVPVSSSREILGNSIVCSGDVRGAEYLKELRREISPEDFYRINPNILSPAYSWPKLRWLQDHEPGLYAKAGKFLLWGDLVTSMLGCDPVTSHSLANRTLLFDIRAEDWSDRLLEIGNVSRDKLPKTMPGGAVCGEVDRTVAGELGLTRGVKVVVGGHDQCCNALGAGICQAGKAVCGVGSFECVTPVYDRLPEDPAAMLANGLNVEHHVLPGLYVSFIFNQSGLLVKWFRDTFATADAELLNDDEDAYDILTAEMPAEPTRLLTLPYFEMTGPPDYVSDASGVIAGLKTGTRRGDILKSILESATFYFVDSVEALKAVGADTSEFVATGGGAKSDAWLQIKADIFGVPFVRPRVTECTVLGAAMLAGLGTGRFASAGEAVRRFVTRDRVFEPDAGRHAFYVEQVAKYREMFPLMKGFLKKLGAS